MALPWYERWFGGHLSFQVFHWRITIYGFNAMHLAVNVWTKRWGYLCFHPSVKIWGRWWPWYFYASPNATPWAATFAIGPGVEDKDKWSATARRLILGHNYDTELLPKRSGYHGEWWPAGFLAWDPSHDDPREAPR